MYKLLTIAFFVLFFVLMFALGVSIGQLEGRRPLLPKCSCPCVTGTI